MEEQEKQSSVKTELEIENMQEFLLENQGIKLENLPTYEDLIAPKVEQPKLDNLQEVNNLPFFEVKEKPKTENPTDSISKKRFKIALSCFACVGVFLLSLVAINGVALAMAKKDINNNQKQISTLTQEVQELEQQGFDIGGLNGEAENVRYKLALPRNYPKDTSELTWFDKLSIFLMKLFG